MDTTQCIAWDELFWQEKAQRSDGYDHDVDDGGW